MGIMLQIGRPSIVYFLNLQLLKRLTIRLPEPVSDKNDFFEWTIAQNEDRSFTATIPATTIQTLEVELIPAAEWAEQKENCQAHLKLNRVKNVL